MEEIMAETSGNHIWRFFRAGGFDQVLLESGDDLRNLQNLDQKLWVALSAPAKGIQFDRRTMELIDLDGDGQIRVPELLTAISWTAERLKSLDVLISAPTGLKLSEIDDQREEGRRVMASSLEILKNLGNSNADSITLEDAIDSEKIFAGTGFNGDGVITSLSTGDENLKEWMARIMAASGSALDRSGEPGVNREHVDNFASGVKEWFEWRSAGETIESGLEMNRIDDICRLWEALFPKIEDYFVRCRVAAFDNRAMDALNSPESELLALGTRSLTVSTEEIAALPLSLVQPEAVLDLEKGLNPAWQNQMEQFSSLVTDPLLGKTGTISSVQWETVKEKMAGHAEWWGAKPVSPVADIDRQLLQEWYEADVESWLKGLIDKDMELCSQAEAIIEVERLLHYVRYLYPLLNNFVAFRDFYTKKGVGIFQCGTLYIDGRSCELCIPVADPAKHGTLATLSRLYLVYCDCVRRGGTEKMTIAAAVTNGDSDQIIVGRNGLFYDYNGDDWDATVVRIIDHPISLRQAFWAPYKKLGRMIGEQIQKMSAARSKAAEDRALAATIKSLDAGTGPKPAAPPPQQQQFDVGKYVGIFAAIGLAIGALGTAVATTLAGFLKLQWWQMPLALGGLLLVVSGPAMIIAWFKLRQRNLGPILDANGWAINARAKLNIPFGASLTALAQLPEGSQQQLTDLFAEKKRPWKTLLLLLIAVIGIFLLIRAGQR